VRGQKQCSRVRNEPQRTAHCSPPNRSAIVNNFPASVKPDLREVFAGRSRRDVYALIPSTRGLSRFERVLRHSCLAFTSALPMCSGSPPSLRDRPRTDNLSRLNDIVLRNVISLLLTILPGDLELSLSDRSGNQVERSARQHWSAEI
jgi:hypothetical protein